MSRAGSSLLFDICSRVPWLYSKTVGILQKKRQCKDMKLKCLGRVENVLGKLIVTSRWQKHLTHFSHLGLENSPQVAHLGTALPTLLKFKLCHSGVCMRLFGSRNKIFYWCCPLSSNEILYNEAAVFAYCEHSWLAILKFIIE